jgi:hypothetical protein
VTIVFDVVWRGHRTRRQAVVQRSATLIKERRRIMAETKTGMVEPTQQQPTPSVANLPGGVHQAALSAKAQSMAPQRTPRAPTQPDIPTAAEGLDAPLPARRAS